MQDTTFCIFHKVYVWELLQSWTPPPETICKVQAGGPGTNLFDQPTLNFRNKQTCHLSNFIHIFQETDCRKFMGSSETHHHQRTQELDQLSMTHMIEPVKGSPINFLPLCSFLTFFSCSFSIFLCSMLLFNFSSYSGLDFS